MEAGEGSGSAYSECIPKEKTCNGVNDCSDGSDEHQSICGNGKCKYNSGFSTEILRVTLIRLVTVLSLFINLQIVFGGHGVKVSVDQVILEATCVRRKELEYQ